MKISNSNVVIVGGSSGIGLGLARRFESMGASVIVTGRSSADFDQSGKTAGLEFLELDVTRRDSVDRFFTRIAQRSLAIDVFVFNAGTMTAEDLVDHDWNPGVAHGIVSVNISGFLNVVGPAIELLRKSPTSTLMVTTSSLAFVPRANFPTYCATKAFLHSCGLDVDQPAYPAGHLRCLAGGLHPRTRALEASDFVESGHARQNTRRERDNSHPGGG